MTDRTRAFKAKTRIATAVLGLAAAGILADNTAAQTYGASYSQQPPPLYPYAVPPQQPYAVEVSPGVYVIQRPAAVRAYPYVDSQPRREPRASKEASLSDRPRKPADRALIEELRQRNQPKESVINTRTVVREPPIVRETTRVIDDPPRIVERRHVVEDLPAPAPVKRRAQAQADEAEIDTSATPDDPKQRVIRAEAEVTILGPDRMSIRLFRKSGAANAKAKARSKTRDED